MNLYDLSARITLDTREYERGIDNARRAAENMSEGMTGAFAKAQIAANLVMKGIELTADALTKVVGGGVDAFARYEQLVGGVDTLFKGSSAKVQKYANEAYTTAGLSANAYMETVTNFSASLLQGLGGDTEMAADVANTAIIDMSDNANKMGTDMASIQHAYMGFAKGNYTMLDNLKLGYGGTKSEMVRLINDSGVLDHKIKDLDGITFDQIIAAIHTLQGELGITGTTAEEAAETIEGSKASLTAAFENLMTMTTADSEGVDSAANAFIKAFAAYFVDNFGPRLQTALAGSGDLFRILSEAILTIPEDFLGDTAASALEGATGLFNGLENVATWLIHSLASMFSNPAVTETGASELGTAIGSFVGTTLKEGITNLPVILLGMVKLGLNLAGGLVTGLVEGLFGEGQNSLGKQLGRINKELAESIGEADTEANKATGILSYMKSLEDQYGAEARETQAWKDALGQLVEIMPEVEGHIDSETGALNTNIETLEAYVQKRRAASIEEAKRQALQQSQEAYYTAVGERESAAGQLTLAQGLADQYWQQMVDWVRSHGDTTFTGLDASGNRISQDQIGAVMYQIAAVDDNSAALQQEVGVMLGLYGDEQATITSLESSMSELDQNVQLAQFNLETMSAALDVASNKLYSLYVPTTQMTSGEYYAHYYSQHATGLDNVPYDGYRAALHKGEAVLTSAEANDWRKGGNGGGVDMSRLTDSIVAAIQNAFDGIGLYMDSERVGSAVKRSVSEGIANDMAAWRFA